MKIHENSSAHLEVDGLRVRQRRLEGRDPDQEILKSLSHVDCTERWLQEAQMMSVRQTPFHPPRGCPPPKNSLVLTLCRARRSGAHTYTHTHGEKLNWHLEMNDPR